MDKLVTASLQGARPLRLEQIDNWDNKPPKHKALKYPQPTDKNSPRMFFVSLFVGSRGSGKTFSCVKLLKQYERFKILDSKTNDTVAQRIIVFSPTITANPIFNSLKHLDEDDIITDYSDDRLVSVIEDIKQEQEETKEYQRKMKLYKKFLKVKKIDDLDQDELFELERMNFEEPLSPMYPNGCVNHLVFDDLVGTDAFKSVGKSALTNLVLKNRHLQCCIYICTQNIKGIPKAIRANTSLFVLFRFANKKLILEDIYQEVSGLLTHDQFEKVYDFATEGENNALVLDFTGTANKIRKNFDQKIIF